MATSETENHTEIRMGSERSFGFVFTVVFLIVALWPALFGNAPRLWAVGAAAAFAAATLVAPRGLKPLNAIWFRFGLLLNRIVSPVVMGILFFLTVTPTGLLRRIRNGDPLKQKIDKSAESYWIAVDRDAVSRSSMRKQF